MARFAILGSGMAGLGAAHRFSEEELEAVVFEKKTRWGGHTVSYAFDDGFVFDDGPHISFTRDERFQNLLADSVNGKYEILQAQVNNHWKGHWIKHPAQCNLYGLPPDLIASILRDFTAAKGDPATAQNYEEWLRTTYGDTFAETFPMEYGEKYHTATAGQMSTEWLGPRLYRPDIDEVLKGALQEDTPDVHYVDHFRYPSRGGFESYLRGFLAKSRIELEHEVSKIDPSAGEIEFSNGKRERFDGVASSIPLPDLVKRIDQAPSEVIEAASRLACTTCVVVNLGIDREDLSECHWTYFYDRDFTVTRASFPHLFSPHNAPPGASSLQAEVYYSDKYRPLGAGVDAQSLIEPVIDDLRRSGLLQPEDEILHRSAWIVPYANVIFDLERQAAVDVVLGYLDEIGIASCGRYGLWGYQWTDESFGSGEAAAQRLLDGLRFGPVS